MEDATLPTPSPPCHCLKRFHPWAEVWMRSWRWTSLRATTGAPSRIHSRLSDVAMAIARGRRGAPPVFADAGGRWTPHPLPRTCTARAAAVALCLQARLVLGGVASRRAKGRGGRGAGGGDCLMRVSARASPAPPAPAGRRRCPHAAPPPTMVRGGPLAEDARHPFTNGCPPPPLMRPRVVARKGGCVGGGRVRGGGRDSQTHL